MISHVSKAFFIPVDPLSPFLSFFVITNFGKAQSTHAAAGRGGVSGGVWCSGGQSGCSGWGPILLGPTGFGVGERMDEGSIELRWCCADVALFGPWWGLSLGCPGSGVNLAHLGTRISAHGGAEFHPPLRVSPRMGHGEFWGWLTWEPALSQCLLPPGLSRPGRGWQVQPCIQRGEGNAPGWREPSPKKTAIQTRRTCTTMPGIRLSLLCRHAAR